MGCLLGGWFSSYLVRRELSVNVARKVALGLSAAVMPLILLVTRAPIAWAIVIFSLAYFGQQSWSTLVMVLPTDLFPSRVVGAVAGLVGFGGAMGGIAFNELAGYLLDHGFGYGYSIQDRRHFSRDRFSRDTNNGAAHPPRGYVAAPAGGFINGRLGGTQP